MQQASLLLNAGWLQYLGKNPGGKISYLSPIPGEKNAWYVWFVNQGGVYEIALLDWQIQKNNEISSFILKYYPYPEEALFESFSCAEQVVRLSAYFDNSLIKHSEHEKSCACSQHHGRHCGSPVQKGIPRLQARADIHPALFGIGKIRLTLRQGRLLQLSADSQDRLMQCSVTGIFVCQGNGPVQIVAPGEVDRDVPGWQLTWTFLEVFRKEVLANSGYDPRKCLRTTACGQVFYQEEGREIWGREDPSVTQITHTFYY